MYKNIVQIVIIIDTYSMGNWVLKYPSLLQDE